MFIFAHNRNKSEMPFKKGEIPKGAKLFKKGETGNPNGRPKLPDLKELISKVLGEVDSNGITSAQRILEALENKAIKGDTKAAEILMNRGWGMPKQSIDAHLTQEQPVIVRNVIDKPNGD